jgi:NAD(P)-dependent dehydrogenase (short-subunit alcohol dehydrogenase family)
LIRLSGQVGVVTGAGGGLGRSYARALAARGATVVVNDLSDAAERVAHEITADGGKAIASIGSVTDDAYVAEMTERVLSDCGRIDILVNNAGFLRDRSFAKMSVQDFRDVVEVHLMGSVTCTKAVWEPMRTQNYGRIVMITSSAGLYGNFGQANYSAAKMALVGLMKTLAIEGAKNNIKVNCLSPTAGTRMLEGLLPPDQMALLEPDAVTPGLLALVRQDAPTQAILCGGAGSFEMAHVTLTQGLRVDPGAGAADILLERWTDVACREGESVPQEAFAQVRLELAKAEQHAGADAAADRS